MNRLLWSYPLQSIVNTMRVAYVFVVFSIISEHDINVLKKVSFSCHIRLSTDERLLNSVSNK